MLWSQLATMLFRKSLKKSGLAIVRCDWSRQISYVWLATDKIFENEKGVFVLENVAGAELTTITKADFALREDDSRLFSHFFEDHGDGLKTFADDFVKLLLAMCFDCASFLPDDDGSTELF